MKKIAIIHTSAVSLEDLKMLCKELIPEVEVINIIDDSMLAEVKKVGEITPDIIARMCSYTQIAQGLNVDLILNQCSSVGQAFDIARKGLKVPSLKVDEPMARKAISMGNKIAVIATVASTLKPSCELVLKEAEKQSRKVEVKGILVEGALDILMQEKNQEKHNELCLEAIKKAMEEQDVVVLAQGSMTVLLPFLEGLEKPVLTSPRLAIEEIKKMLLI